MGDRKAGILFAALFMGVASLVLLVLPGFARIPEAVKALAPLPNAQKSKMFLRAVVVPPESDAEIVILQESGGKLMLPLFVTHGEGEAIRRARQGDAGADLLTDSVKELGGSIQGVLLDEASDKVDFNDPLASDVGAQLILSGKDHHEVKVHAGAAEGVLAAVSAGSPIWVTPQVLASEGMTLEDLEEVARSAKPDASKTGEAVSM